MELVQKAYLAMDEEDEFSNEEILTFPSEMGYSSSHLFPFKRKEHLFVTDDHRVGNNKRLCLSDEKQEVKDAIRDTLSGFFCQHEDSHTFVSLNHQAYDAPDPSLEFLPVAIKIRSSSGGLLLCQSSYDEDSYYICNPATEKCKKLVEPVFYHGLRSAAVLAIDPSLLNPEAHYQVICAVPLFGEKTTCFEVYSSESSSWSQLSTPLDLGNLSFVSDGLWFKGMAYWEITNGDVLAFDAMNEIYEIIHLPSDYLQGGVLSKLHDEVCYITKSSDDASNPCVKIYGGIGFGILKCTIFLEKVQGIEGNRSFRILPCGQDGVLMILVGRFIYSYKLGSENFELKSDEGIGCWSQVRYLPYVTTFASVY